jgi:hypothetical protein
MTVVVLLVSATVLLWAGLHWAYNEAFGSNDAPFGYIDKTGAQVIDRGNNRPLTPDTEKGPFSEGLAVISITSMDTRKGPYFSYINKSGKIIETVDKFVSARPFSEGLAAVQIDPHNCWAFVDTSGKRAIQPTYLSVQDFSEGLAGVEKGNLKWQFIKKDGSLAFNKVFDGVTPFSQGRSSVRIGGKWGLIDLAGNQILEPTYQNYIHPYSDGAAAVEIPDSSQVDYLDLNGKVILSVQRSYPSSEKIQGVGPDPAREKAIDTEVHCDDPISGFPLPNVDASEGLVVFEDKGKYGYKDLAGHTVIEPKYDYCWQFSEGLALVLNRSAAHGLGYIDRNGQQVVSCSFSRAFPFSEGLAAVAFTKNGASLYINKQGQDIFHKNPFGGGLYGTPLADARAFREWLQTDFIVSFLKTKQSGTEPKNKSFMEAQPFHEGLARVGKQFIWI